MKFTSINPHNQQPIYEFSSATDDEIVLAVNIARQAYNDWKKMLVADRVSILKKYAILLKAAQSELAKTITLEMGRPFKHTMMDIDWEMNYVHYYLDHAEIIYGSQTLSLEAKEHFYLRYEPYGVVVCICPWNFPVSMAHSGVIPALLAGNTVIIKPSELTTKSQSMIAELMCQAGLPSGVLQTVIGDGRVGQKLLEQNINMVWFTGSTETGRYIYKTCGERFLKSVCEMGGSSAAIVCKDAELENAVNSVYFSRFNNAGQTCKAVKRLFVDESIYDLFLEKLLEKIKKTNVGNPWDDVDMGPLASATQIERLEAQLTEAIHLGAEIVIGGKRVVKQELLKGNYFEPTLLSNVTSNMRVMTEEVFGPVLPIIKFSSIEEVVTMVNNTQFGLTNEVFTQDKELYNILIPQLESGVVAINTDRFYRPYCPIGGFKQSGMGREYGQVGMQEFSQIKLVAIYETT
jgi:acyl-CoA reductase-like NAD-dependent aldehyde dehydrogenase